MKMSESRKGKVWVTDGETERFVKEDDIPNDFVYGRMNVQIDERTAPTAYTLTHENGVVEEIKILKSWCARKGLNYHKVFNLVDRGVLLSNPRFKSKEYEWFIGKELIRL